MPDTGAETRWRTVAVRLEVQTGNTFDGEDHTVLGDAFCNPVLPASDGVRARIFYRDVLGLELASGPDDDPMFFRAGAGSALVVTEIPERVPPDYQMVSFIVTDLARVVEGLLTRGVTFVEPAVSSFAGVTGSVDGYVVDYGPVRSAVLVDSEGNRLALNEIVAG